MVMMLVMAVTPRMVSVDIAVEVVVMVVVVVVVMVVLVVIPQYVKMICRANL